MPIHAIAKELGIESNDILLACKDLGIYAKGSSKRLNDKDSENIRNYFKNGKNVRNEIIDLDKTSVIKEPIKEKKIDFKKESNNKYFRNRLIK